MAFWSDLGKKISDTTQSVVEKTKTSTDTMRLNGLISDEERNVQRIYAEIGRKYMELHGADGDPDFAGLMQEYQTSKAKMEEYRSRLTTPVPSQPEQRNEPVLYEKSLAL